jgi:hypothetical protein
MHFLSLFLTGLHRSNILPATSSWFGSGSISFELSRNDAVLCPQCIMSRGAHFHLFYLLLELTHYFRYTCYVLPLQSHCFVLIS